MDVTLHLEWFARGQDPIVWLRMARVLILAVCAVLMFSEVMMCGGRNRSLHRLLALAMLSAAMYSWGVARARMIVLTNDPLALAPIDLLVYEMIYTATSTAILIRLGYDFYRWRTYNAVKHQPHDCGKCDYTFTP